MTAPQIMACCVQAVAIMQVCNAAAWSIQNGGDADLAGSIEDALSTARELL